MAAAIDVREPGKGLSDATSAQLAAALAWKSAVFGAKQTGKAMTGMPRALHQLRAYLPRGPLARAAEHGFSIWSTESKWSIASIKSHGSAWSVWSMLSLGSVGSLGSAGCVASVGSAGSLLSIGSVGSILSIGSAGSVLSIGGVNQQPWGRKGYDGGEGTESPTLTVIEQGGTLLGLLAVAGAVRSTVRPR